ncbi:glycosyltransferase family 4 protein [Flavobacterium hibisci]|uniref:glycosyltransferase family 4 protein n=1 Tax=Flavobacterium hibisci TaxID=1914462 RepID=UPI001CBEDB69|nr:glycosyltransferase family 4 protein [Flavobacterium hibisci]MBZ4042528.1 glycosyltransferase family 4 protein [Flavobacterium hibisci]
MKILYIAPDITDSGGISRVVSLKTNYLVSHLNYEVQILSVNNSYPNCFYDFDSAIKWHVIRESSKNPLFLRSYIRLIKKTISTEKPDIIVVCDAVLWLFIPWFIKTEIPLIFETHFSVFYQKEKNETLYNKFRTKLVRFLKQKTIIKFNCFVTTTEEGDKERGVNNTQVIPNPLSFSSKNKAVLVNKKAMAVCMNPYVKGLDRLLLIWSRFVKKHPDWVIDIYGQLDVKSEYQKMADDLKISDNVNFLPPTSDIQNSYNDASVFLMTSRTEAFGMVLIEAMVSGVPCIAYNCPSGPRAIIEEGANGFLIKDENVDSFVQKLELLIEDENLRIQMGSNAQESVRKYEIDSIMKRWDELFKSFKKSSDKFKQ